MGRRIQKNVEANGGNPADLQVTDQFLFRCVVKSLMKVKSLVVEPTEVETMPFTDIETVLKNYLQPRERLVIAEQSKFVAITRRNGESSGSFLAKLREASRFCVFGKLKTVDHPEAYIIQLRFIAGLQNSKQEMKILEYLQNKPEATIDDILLVIQQREQTVHFVTKQSEPTESVSFVRNGSRQRKNDWTGKKTHYTHIFSKACPKCGTKHEPRSCPAFGKKCNSCKRPNHFAKMCRTKRQSTNFVVNGSKANEIEESASDYSFFIGYSNYIKNVTTS